jgi:SAM-dependent methyltransferase
METYRKHAAGLLGRHDEKRAMALAVGGDYEAVGTLEYFLLLQHGLQRGHTVVDVGCGSGRLAVQLKEYLTGTYIGIDVVPELHEYARNACGRPDWKFYTAPGVNIPEPDGSADFVCFFSVFTHLTHEDSFRYLAEAARVLRPGGRIVFSFLEFRIFGQWCLFRESVKDARPDKVLNQFMDRDAIRVWSEHLGLKIVEIDDGDQPHIRLEKPVRWDDGRVMTDLGCLGQSVCVLTK